jgi:hypothetical protein
MTRRLETGPLLVMLGAVLLIVALFLPWYGPDEFGAWEVFEVWDLALAALGIASLLAAAGLLTPDIAALDRRWLPATALAALVIVAVQIVDPPPAATGLDPDTGAWLALGAAVVMGIGAVLTFSRVRLSFTVEGRDPRRHVPAVDARGEDEPATSEEEPAGGLFSRGRRPVAEPETPSPAAPGVAGRTEDDDETLMRSRARRLRRAAETKDDDDATEERPG